MDTWIMSSVIVVFTGETHFSIDIHHQLIEVVVYLKLQYVTKWRRFQKFSNIRDDEGTIRPNK